MNVNKAFLILVLLTALATLASMLVPQASVSAGCSTPFCPPPTKASSGGSGVKKRPTAIPPTPTATLTPTPVPSSTPMVPLAAGGGNTGNQLPAVQNPGGGSAPFPFPGSFGMLILVVLIGLLAVGLILVVRNLRGNSPIGANEGTTNIMGTLRPSSGDQFLDGNPNMGTVLLSPNPSGDLGDGLNQFVKFKDGMDQYVKFKDGSDQTLNPLQPGGETPDQV